MDEVTFDAGAPIDTEPEFGDLGGLTERRERPPFDPASLVIGLWLAGVGTVAAIVGAEQFDDALAFVIPGTFAITGLGLLLPKRPRRPRDTAEDPER